MCCYSRDPLLIVLNFVAVVVFQREEPFWQSSVLELRSVSSGNSVVFKSVNHKIRPTLDDGRVCEAFPDLVGHNISRLSLRLGNLTHVLQKSVNVLGGLSVFGDVHRVVVTNWNA